MIPVQKFKFFPTVTNGLFYSIWTRNKRFSSLFWRYLSHLLVDYDARYRFRKVISCRLHDWNLNLKFAKFRVKVGPRSRNLLKKVRPLTTFSWITLKFNVFCWDKYYFSESLGCKKIMMNLKTVYYYIMLINDCIIKLDGVSWPLSQSRLFFIWNHKTVKRSLVSNRPRNKLHSHTQFSMDFCKICTKILEKDYIL